MSKRLKLFDLLKRESATLFAGAHDVHTPKELTVEILSELELKEKNILVMFNPEFVISLVEIFEVAPDTITFYSDHTNKNKLMERFGVKYITKLEKRMKFDVVLGNPPYQNKSENSDGALWLQFVNKGMELLEDEGKLAFLSPTSWVGKTTNTKKANFSPFTDNHIELFKPLSDEEKKTYFGGVGSTFGYYIISKGAGKTKIILNDGSSTVVTIKNGEPLPAIMNQTSMSIHNKLAQFNKMEFASNFKMHSQRLKKANVISDTKDSEYQYTTYYSHNLIRYSSAKHELFADLKVMIPIVGTLKNAWASDNCNFTEDVRYRVVQSEEDANNTIAVLKSKLFSYIGKNYRSGRNLGMVLKFLPAVDTTREWTDAELYAYFGLTEDEIRFVEANN